MSSVKLFPHQEAAVKWMSSVESRPRIVPEQPHGGILAHAMGLGKTTSMLSLIGAQGLQSTLVICPKSVLSQWRDEAVRVLGLTPDQIIIFHGPNRKHLLRESNKGARLVLTTYDIARMDHPAGVSRFSTLGSENWSRVVLDEAHRICEQSSKTAKAIRSLRARNRWCVTGTPFKNGVADLVALAKFLNVPPYCNSTWWRINSMNYNKIREWRNSFLNLQDKSVLQLPHVEELNLTPERICAEQWLVDVLEKIQLSTTPGASKFMAIGESDLNELRCGSGISPSQHQEHELLKILRLRQAANHPLMLASPDGLRQLLENGVSPVGCNACGRDLQQYIDVTLEHRDKRGCAERANDCSHQLCVACTKDLIVCPCCIAERMPMVETPSGRMWTHSSKTELLWSYLQGLVNSDTYNKIVIFSQWTSFLDLLALMLDSMLVSYLRFDGRVNNLDERSSIISKFREEKGNQILLTSLGAGGEGINLTCANVVILLEPYWNSAVEQQAIDRLHRIGQTQITQVVRLRQKSSIEDWVVEIQNKKTCESERLLRGNHILKEVIGDQGSRSKVPVSQQLITADNVLNIKQKFNEPFVFDGSLVGLGRFLVNK